MVLDNNKAIMILIINTIRTMWDMRYKMKRKSILVLILFILIFFQPMTAYADMGPKPCIYITFNNLGDRTVYASLFALEGGPSPVSFGDWDKVPNDIRQIFLEYSETEDARFVEEIWIISADNPTMECGYMPPYEYKLVVYIPDENRMVESDYYTRDRFEEWYSVKISGKNEKLVLAYDWQSNVLPIITRVILTVIIELVIAFLFRIKGKKSVRVIIITNVATQLFLNISLLLETIFLGGGILLVLLYLLLEINIFFTESIVYSLVLKKTNNPPVGVFKAISYAFIANLVTFLIGIFVHILF